MLGSHSRQVTKKTEKFRYCRVTVPRQVAQDFIAGEALHGLAKRHDISRNLIRIWVKKLEAEAFDEDARAAEGRTDHAKELDFTATKMVSRDLTRKAQA